MATSDIDKLERELKQELEEFDRLLSDEMLLCPIRQVDAFELAEAEGEKEELQDRLHVLLTRAEDFENQLGHAQERILALTIANESLMRENRLLSDMVRIYPRSTSETVLTEDLSEATKYNELEYKFAETRSQLARSQQTAEDLSLTRDLLEKELEQERRRREHAEKERDAYSSAYEASLKHFEKWSEKKQQQKMSPFYRR
jgi:septal ring factor EnvC (AmiA/AmiB activator)